jgi:hypothetical protein
MVPGVTISVADAINRAQADANKAFARRWMPVHGTKSLLQAHFSSPSG